jgi:hypothetical protein
MLRAVRPGNGRLLVLAGLLAALALQTHISVIAFAPGLALGLWLLRPSLLTSRWTVGAAAAFFVGYSNMLLFNFQNGFWSFVHARALQQGYSGGQPVDLTTYLSNLSALLESLSRLVSGTIDEAGNPAALVYLLVAVAGLVMLARRGVALPLLFCLSAALILPYFNPRYGPILSGRYIVPLLPFAYVGVALAADEAMRRLPSLRADLRPVAVRVALTTLVLFPLAPLALYYREALGEERTNRPLLQLSETLGDAYRAGDLVLVDEALAQEALTAGGTDLKALRVLLEAGGIPYRVAKLSGAGLLPTVSTHPRVLVVMDARKVDQLGKHVRAAAVGPEVESASGSGHGYAVYRIGPRNGAPAFAEKTDDFEGWLDLDDDLDGLLEFDNDPAAGLDPDNRPAARLDRVGDPDAWLDQGEEVGADSF